MKPSTYALSIKQPWAALVVHGRKFIEVRRWSTTHRGPLLIHAAKVADPRPEAWRHIDDELRKATETRGGIVGSVEVTGCIQYGDAQTFISDRQLHLNDPTWFCSPAMYGFVIVRAKPLPFRPLLGNVRLFRVREVKRK